MGGEVLHTECPKRKWAERAALVPLSAAPAACTASSHTLLLAPTSSERWASRRRSHFFDRPLRSCDLRVSLVADGSSGVPKTMEETVDSLLARMNHDMGLAGHAVRTRDIYLSAIRDFAAHRGRSPADLAQDDVRQWIAHLSQRRLSAPRMRQHFAALKFLYAKTCSPTHRRSPSTGS